MNKKLNLLLFLIIVFAGVLRIFALNRYPAGLNADEAAIGYNAYSLIQTGKDEYGELWPINFKSFGDYKPGLYFYFVLPFVKLFGLNIWAVRLPSAILGTVSVFLIYLLVNEIFKDKAKALVSASLLAISPWHIHFSRGGWESNAAIFFILAAVFVFFKALKKPVYFPISCLLFLVSMYAYHSARVISPLLGLGLIIFYRKELFNKRNWRYLLLAGILFIILLFPLIKTFTGPAGVSRFSGVGLFADQGPLWRVNELRGEHQDISSLPAKGFHNKLIAYGLAFADNWLKHFHGEFLFLSGDEVARNRVPETGQMYIFDFLWLVAGIYFLVKKRLFGSVFIFWWLAISPAAAAMTFQSPNAIRALNMVIPLMIICAYGLVELWRIFSKKRLEIKRFIFSLIFIIISWGFARYLHQYYSHYPKTYPYAWEDGFGELVSYVGGRENEFNKIYVTNKYDQPYILFLFYLRYPPSVLQAESELTPKDEFGFSTVSHFGKYVFGKINWEKINQESNILVVASPEEAKKDLAPEKIVYYRNGNPAFIIFKR